MHSIMAWGHEISWLRSWCPAHSNIYRDILTIGPISESASPIVLWMHFEEKQCSFSPHSGNNGNVLYTCGNVSFYGSPPPPFVQTCLFRGNQVWKFMDVQYLLSSLSPPYLWMTGRQTEVSSAGRLKCNALKMKSIDVLSRQTKIFLSFFNTFISCLSRQHCANQGSSQYKHKNKYSTINTY